MDYQIVKDTKLFQSISEEDFKNMMVNLDIHIKDFKKGESVLRAGEEVNKIGLVISGSINFTVYFFWGNSNIFHHVKEGEIFGESYSEIKGQKLLGNLVASEDTRILFINTSKMSSFRKDKSSYHIKLMENLLKIISQKNVELSKRMVILGGKTIRNRILSFLSQTSISENSRVFEIPFSRQEMADYLNVDRSALSSELSKMQKEGLIRYRKNHFELYADEEGQLKI